VFGYSVIELAIWAVIDECADGNTSDQLRNSAHMILVVMREQHIVDLRKSGLPGSRDDAVCVASIIVLPTCIDEKRLSRSRYEKCRLAALDVDEVNLQSSRGIVEADGSSGRGDQQA
jgi:hypothetical protein